MGASLTVLGAGSILPRTGYGCAGYALRPAPGAPVTLLDCGPGSVRALGAAGIELADVQRVVFSHYHPDHCLDVFALAFARRNPFHGPPPPLERVGPKGLLALLGAFAGGPAASFARYTADPRAADREVEPGEPVEAEGVTFTSVATGHTPESLAWRADLADGGSLLYTGDTGENPAVSELGRGVDWFVAECSFPDEEAVEHHLTPSSAARMARDAGAARLVLSHFYPPSDPEQARRCAARTFTGPIHVAADGKRFELDDGTR